MLTLPLRRNVAFAAAFLSGLLYWLGFAGMDRWACAFVAFVPLLIALRGQTPKRALVIGLITGTTMNVFGFYWLLNMLKTFSGFPQMLGAALGTSLCALFVLIICTYQGGRLALMGWLYARGEARGWPAAPLFLGAFAASELLFPLLFPWYFAASVHNVPSLSQTAELGGPILVGLILVGANLAVAEPLLARLEGRKLDRRLMIAGAGGLGLALLFGVVRILMVERNVERAPSLHVGIVQANMGLMEKRVSFDEGLRRHLDLTRALKDKGADLVVWSETSVMRPSPVATYERAIPLSVGHRIGLPAIFGVVLYEQSSNAQRGVIMYNTALATDGIGLVTSRYDKEYLLTFGEYLPFGDTFPILYEWSPHSGRFSPGTDTTPLIIVDKDAARHSVTALICYEDILPSFTNKAVHKDTELLVNITNDAWFGATAEPWEHLALAKLRAIEHRRYLVRSTNSGVSAVVDPVGRAIKTSEVRDVQEGSGKTGDSLYADIHWMRASTVYEAIGDSPWWLFAVASVVAAFQRRQGAGA
jgi:apolipoprotein N-acyltransferase